MNLTKALCEGFVAELNQEWRNTDFYFWVETLAPDVLGVLCQQTLFGKRRQCLRITIKEAVVEISRFKPDSLWDVVQRLELDNPKCLDKLHSIVKRELAHV